MKKKSGKRKIDLLSVILIVALLVGLSLMLYPTVSNYWNERHQSYTISSYNENVVEMDSETVARLLEEAHDYNQYILTKSSQWLMTQEDEAYYSSVLNIGDTGVMGVVEIPAINVSLPIYHGVDDDVLQIAAGHLEQTSLPVGGKGTHAVISGHRGLPSATLFTNLDKLVEGDIFYITVLTENLTYEVDQILIVEPNDLSALDIDPEQDYVTLVTCTPYGVNSHRLLVRGHRIATSEDEAQVTVLGEAALVDKLIVAPFIAVPVLVLLFLWMMLRPRRRSGRGKKA